MKLRRRYSVLFLAVTLALGFLAYLALNRSCQEAYTPDNLIRLHVIANSDRLEDQALKLKVRDAIVAEMGPRLATAGSVEEAEALVRAHQERLAKLASSQLAAAGVPYGARVELGNFVFPTRSYYDVVLPAGDYKAVRVVLGEGTGQNWWCVLFPPLCFVDIASTGEPPLAQEAIAGPSIAGPSGDGAREAGRPPVETRWRILEIIQRSYASLPAFGLLP